MKHHRILAIGAHPDDIELGCGASLAHHVAAGDEVTMLVLTNGQNGPGQVSERIEEATEAAGIIGAEIIFGGLLDGEVTEGKETVSIIESVVKSMSPSIIYTHGPNDSHQDHRHTSAATMSAARNMSTILFYQSPSAYRFDPSFFIAVNDDSIHVKMEALRKHSSQVVSSDRVSMSAVDAAARYWGNFVRTKYAECFEVSRILAYSTRNGLIVGDRRRFDADDSQYEGEDRRGAPLTQYDELFASFRHELNGAPKSPPTH